MGVARTLSASHGGRTHILPSVEPPNCTPRARGAGSRVGCGLSLFSGFLPVCPEQTPRPGVTRAAWYQRPGESSPHPDVLPYRGADGLSTATRIVPVAAGLDPNQASGPGTSFLVNPCGNFSGTSSLKFRGTKGSIGHTFMVCIHTENQNQGGFYPFVLLEISVLHEPPLGHLRYCLTDVPPQPNSPPDNVFNPDQPLMRP